MRKSLLMMAVLGAISAPAAVFAAEPVAETPAYTLTYNTGLYSSYQFRGITLSGGRPALQASVDLVHSSGFYIGMWGSNISWLQDAGYYKRSSIEIDLYGGYRNTIPNTEITYDIALLQYLQPGDRISPNASANTLEGSAALGYKWVTAKYWRILTDGAYGTRDARGTEYYDLTANIPFADTGISAILHVGRQEFTGASGANDDLYSYTDWKAGVSKAWDNGVTLGGYYTDTNANKAGYTFGNQFAGSDRVTVFINKTF